MIRRVLGSAVTIVGLLWFASGTRADVADPAAERVSIHITARTMTAALIQLSEQTGLQLLFQTDAAATQLSAPAIEGRFTPRAALEQLLRDSGLTYHFVNERTVSIARARQEGVGRHATAGSGDKSR
jgi:hypothetical protein